LSSQKFHPWIEKRMRDAQVEPPLDQNPKCQEAEESRMHQPIPDQGK